jgi:hypothetical protein
MIDYRGTVLNLPPEVLGQVDLAVHTRFTATTPPLAVRSRFPYLWKDAGPDIPILQQARTEYARLK